MNISKIRACIGKGDWRTAEDLWMTGASDSPSPEAVREALEAFVASEKADTAETLGWALLEAHGSAEPDKRFAYATACLLAVPESQELRKAAIELAKEVYSDHENFDVVWAAAGLDGTQSPRRALRTLATCLAITEGCFMANKFDHRVIRLERLNALGEYEFEEDGMTESLEPKKLADEFDVLEPDDFRVLRQSPDIAKMMRSEAARILVGLCLARGGEITSDQIRQTLCPDLLADKSWSGWWSKARTAARKDTRLTLEGRNPVTVTFHPAGRTLEEEMEDALQAAYEPDAYLAVLRDYQREVSTRSLEPSSEFLQEITDGLAERARQWQANRPADALEAVLCAEEAEVLGAPSAHGLPEPSELVDRVRSAPETLATLGEDALWPLAIKAIQASQREEEILVGLLTTAPSERLEAVVASLVERDQVAPLAEIMARALANPAEGLDLLLWAWSRAEPAPMPDPPSKLMLLTKVLSGVSAMEHMHEFPADQKRRLRQSVRSALSASDFAQYRAALDEADEHMAQVVRRLVERTDALAQAVRERMVTELRNRFYKMFVKAKIQPWENAGQLWTTQVGYDARVEEMRVLTEELMPANAKQIGEAAEEGDLRENADWQAAIEERDMLIARQRKLNDEMARARILSEDDVPTEHVGIGSRAVLKRPDGSELRLTFLGPWDSDIASNIYAYTTGLGQSLMGKAVGETVELELEGEARQYTLDAIENGLAG